MDIADKLTTIMQILMEFRSEFDDFRVSIDQRVDNLERNSVFKSDLEGLATKADTDRILTILDGIASRIEDDDVECRTGCPDGTP